MKNWPQTTKELTAQLRNLRGGTPEVMKTFSGLAQAALAPKALDGKTKELIALGMAIYMGAGPTVMYASHALDAFEQFRDRTKAPSSTAA